MLIMERAISAFTNRCLRSAARRWPSDIRADLHAEWLAELHALRSSGNGVRGGWRRLRFAASLAMAPSVEAQEEQRARVDVERFRALGRPVGNALAMPVLTLLAAPLFVFVVAAVICAVVGVLFAVLLRDGYLPASRFVFQVDWQANNRIDWQAHLLEVTAVALCAAALAAAGHWLGGRLPLWAAHRGRLALAGSAVLTPIVVATGGTLLYLGAPTDFPRVRIITGHVGPNYAGGIAAWVIATTLAGWWLTRHRITWPRTMLAAVVAADVAVTVAGLRSASDVGVGTGTAAWWFPLSLLCPDGWGPADAGIWPLTAVSSQLFDAAVLALTCSCFVLAYGARTARLALAVGSMQGDHDPMSYNHHRRY